ncbi:MAG: rubrerythrin family protein, partial [Candidatus Hodarchaeales archaeon]
MRKMTEKNLNDAFAGESQAHMRYLAFGDKAEKEGFSNIARLFKATSFAEQVHATKHFKTLGGIKGTSDNLQAAIDGEHFEQHDMYPAYVAVAELEGEKAAKKSAEWALESEKLHEALYKKAKESVDAGKDM